MYKRVLLKLSGEALSGNSKNFDADVLHSLAEEIKEAQSLGVEIAIVVGGVTLSVAKQSLKLVLTVYKAIIWECLQQL